jgi:hypothetical protein
MARNLVEKVMWFGRATVFAVGLVAIFALLLGVAYVAFSTLSGSSDQRDAIPPQVGIDAGADQTLALEALAKRRMPSQGFAQVNHTGPTLTSSKGVVGVERSDTVTGLYCFDLSFTPRAAVASANINNNATVGTIVGGFSGCEAPFRDAAAKVYGANDPNSVPRTDVSFGIVFMR